MDSDFERILVGELDDVASNLVVPPLPDLAVSTPRRRRLRAAPIGRVDRWAPFLVAAAVVVLAVFVTLGTPRHREQPAPPVPTPIQEPASTEPKLISYEGAGSARAQVRTTADANTLAGAPDSFKTFIGRTAERLNRGGTCHVDFVGVTMKALRTDGYAVGAVNGCSGGHVALWAIVEGGWREIDATQDLWDCAVLAEHRVPSDIAGDTCYDADAKAQHAYRQP